MPPQIDRDAVTLLRARRQNLVTPALAVPRFSSDNASGTTGGQRIVRARAEEGRVHRRTLLMRSILHRIFRAEPLRSGTLPCSR